MDYLLNAYVFDHLPFGLSEPTKKRIGEIAMNTVVIADWFCGVKGITELALNHVSLCLMELVFFFLWIMTLVHALRYGRRYIYTWISILFLAFAVESVKFWHVSLDVIWYAQASVTFFGLRTPMYILFGAYHIVFYTSYVLAKRMHLKWYAEGIIQAFAAFLLAFPMQFCGIKFLWWQWHSDDPRLQSKFLTVPSVAIGMICVLACSFNYSIYFLRKRFLPEIYNWKRFVREFMCGVAAAASTIVFSGLLYLIVYEVPYDIFRITHQIPTNIILTMCILSLFWKSQDRAEAFSTGRGDEFDVLTMVIVINYAFFVIMTAIITPESVIAQGVYQSIGPCDHFEPIPKFGSADLHRDKYFCLEKPLPINFDFHCVPGGVKTYLTLSEQEPLQYYTICGTKFENPVWFIAILCTFVLASLSFIYTAILRFAPTALDSEESGSRRLSLRQERIQQSVLRSRLARGQIALAELANSDQNMLQRSGSKYASPQVSTPVRGRKGANKKGKAPKGKFHELSMGGTTPSSSGGSHSHQSNISGSSKLPTLIHRAKRVLPGDSDD